MYQLGVLIVEEILKLVRDARDEGIKLVRSKAIALAVRAIRGFRYILLLQYAVMFMCFLSAISLFCTLYLLTSQIGMESGFDFSPPLALCIGSFLFSTGMLALTLSEKMWFRVFGIEELARVEIEHEQEESRSGEYEAMAKMVEEIIDRKLKEEEENRRMKRKKRDAEEAT